MSSTTARAHPDKRGSANGTGPDGNMKTGASRPPRASAHDSFRSERDRDRDRERPDPRHKEHGGASPRPDSQTGFQTSGSGHTSTSHKRSASGNVRPSSRTVEERRTEKIQVTTRETLTSRTRSPDRRSAAQQPPGPGPGAKEKARPKPVAEPRPREAPRPEPPQTTWEPEATLLPHTTAPLASRISVPPLASQQPVAVQPRPLHDLPLAVQEALILEDLLFVFMGIEGQYIRYAKVYNPHEERDRLTGPTFRVLPGLDPSLQDLTVSMLRMATHYSALMAFVDVQSKDEFGSVNHALCASMRRILQDYLVLVAQLETQFLTEDGFTLHVLNIHLLPTAHMLLQLYGLAHELLKKNGLLDDESDVSSDDDSSNDYDKILNQLQEGGNLLPGNMAGKGVSKGGVVLGIISNRLSAMSGDPAARALLTTLLRDASRPYMAMLNEWLHHGGINDPHAEFMVREQKSIRRERLEQDYTDEYWERRYTIRDQDVPPQLQGVRDKVLLAGKYLNVVRECGGVDVSTQVRDVPLSFDDARFLDNVNRAYAHANESLMRLLLTAHALPARLQSLKHYFFLDPSDYFSHFLELGQSELRKPVRQVNTSKLQSLLDIVLRQPGTAVSLDPFKEDVKVEMNEVTLIKSLKRVVEITGIEQGEGLQPLMPSLPTETDKNAPGYTCLQLDYAVPFPVSLVISRKTVWRYQALFRYLLSLRYMESQLSTLWQHQNNGVVWTHRSSSVKIEAWKRRVFTLRARMLVFVQQLLYFCTAEVIEPNWQALMARLKTKGDAAAAAATAGAGAEGGEDAGGPTRTVDELMKDHVDFLDTCLKECMLTNSKLLRVNAKVIQTCQYFVVFSSRRWFVELLKADPDLAGPTRPPNMTERAWAQVQILKAEVIKASASSSSASVASSSSAALGSALGGGGGGSSAAGGGGSDSDKATMWEFLPKYEVGFSKHLGMLLDHLNHYAATETVVLLSLCARLSAANEGTGYAGSGSGARGDLEDTD